MCSERAGMAAPGSCSGEAPPWPSAIELHCASRTMELVWGGTRAMLAHRQLRLACRCADCESARRKGVQGAQVAADVKVTRVEPVGENGLRLFFSDGHDRGIFPWAYLYRMAFGTV